MELSALPKAIQDANVTPVHTDEEVYEHFRSKYQLIPYNGREVFLFTNQREFRDRKHIVSFHGSNSPRIPEHIYQYVLITYCYAGEFHMTVDGGPLVLGAGDCLVTDRHVPHSVEPTGPDDVTVDIVVNDRFFERRMLADISRLHAAFPSALVERGGAHTGWRVYRTAGDEFPRELVSRILCEHLDARAGSSDIIDDLIAALLTHLFRTFEPDAQRSEAEEKRSALIGEVREYVAEHYNEGSLKRMSERLGYESTYLSTMIRKATGMTFKQLVNQERMRHAMMLLQGTDLPAYAIAQEVGISNLTQFYKRFREFVGCTPQEYRDRT